MIREKLSLKEKIGYGFGDAASSMFWKLFTMYLMFFYTDIFGIPAALVGTMFLITRIWDAAFDPFVGILGDRTNTRWGKFRPYLLWIALPFGIAGVLTFTSPDLSATGKIVYAYASYSLMMMIYSLINVPYASLMGVMSADGKERTTLATFRFIFAFSGSIVALALAEPLATLFSNMATIPDPQFGWQMTALVFAVLAVIMFLLTFILTRERIKPITEKTSLKEDISDLGKNFPWFMLLGAGISVIFFNSIRDGVAIYYFKYYMNGLDGKGLNTMGLTFTISSFYFVIGQAANIVGVIAAKPLSDKFGKKNTFIFAMIIIAILSFLFYFISKENISMVFLLQFLISINAGIVLPLLWSMYADSADYSEWKTGRRATGLIFSASSMSQKFGWTIGGALGGWILALYGFRANEIQNIDTQNGIRMMVSIYPAIGALLAAAFMFIYPLKETLIEKIEDELAQRRSVKS